MRKAINIITILSLIFILVTLLFFPIGEGYIGSANVTNTNLGISYYRESSSATVSFIDTLRVPYSYSIYFSAIFVLFFIVCIIDLIKENVVTKIFMIIMSILLLWLVSHIYHSGLYYTAANIMDLPYGDFPEASSSALADINEYVLVAIAFIQALNILIYFVNKKKTNQYVISDNIVNNEVESNELSQLKSLKDLLDSGVITQEEFEQKKKQLLGL